MTAKLQRLSRFWPAVLLASALALVAMTMLSVGASSSGTLVTATGQHRLTLEVANTPETREIGLMDRPSMAADTGMLFDFKETRPVTMWMKNTYLSLDMLFLDEAGKVTHVAAHAQPLSLALISSQGPVRYVVELNGGAAAQYGVKVGDHLEHPSIPSAP
ncbi:hypothetical protein Sa4125_25700 [Aureimonas sp. SA4125]|uniref:DUF192 domain-containing protein n=1 Tax=Aureimonas sp. SA4125 TaxID=2826993 RepID=UPI001CC5C9A5|nr:DUF192 domain-containing protein [Aureimonas sp. SA4125]BDA85028.1 hypothetical protein Sa4125_25700 [Aureimonas sp. SA4125]